MLDWGYLCTISIRASFIVVIFIFVARPRPSSLLVVLVYKLPLSSGACVGAQHSRLTWLGLPLGRYAKRCSRTDCFRKRLGQTRDAGTNFGPHGRYLPEYSHSSSPDRSSSLLVVHSAPLDSPLVTCYPSIESAPLRPVPRR